MRPIPAALTLALTLLLVTSPAGPAAAAPDLTLFARCFPDSIRPDSEAVFTCTTSVTSNEDVSTRGVTLTGTLSPDASLPSFEIFDRSVNGVPVFVSPGQITYDFPEVPAFNTVDAVSRVIFGSRDAATYGFRLELRVDGELVDSADVTFEATASSPYPPQGLEVTKTLVDVLPRAEPLSPPAQLSPPSGFPIRGELAVYEITIRNVGGAPIDALTVWDRVSPGALLGANDPPAVAVDDATGVSRWELAGLAPGEEMSIRVTVEPDGDACPLSSDTVIVQAGDDLYLGRPDRAVVLGLECALGQGGDGGRGGDGEVSLPATGTGDGAGAGWLWLAGAGALAAAAAAAIGASRRLR